MAVSPTEEIFRFGLFELDLKAGQLSRSGRQLRLPQQPLQLLALLLERPGEILTRDELRQRLWPSDVFVDFDHGLNKSIQKIRDVLGDSAGSPRYIQTIPRVGYRFIAPLRNGTLVREPEAPVGVAADPVAPESPSAPAHAPAVIPARSPTIWRGWVAGGAMAAVVLGVTMYFAMRPHPNVVQYTQLTDFTDSASLPALSPDGHMLAFMRTDSSFMSADQVYVKMLPRGEARRLTNDNKVKYNLAFSPDGSRIAYSIMDQPSFSTYTISVLGGDPQLLLKNAAGLSWLNPHTYLFSRIRSGLHLGIVTASAGGDNLRELYYPAHERAMAHYSSASPDQRLALVVEMDGAGAWTNCKLISIQGPPQAQPIGPTGACTAASWSPKGDWMYFISSTGGPSHLWRQHFPDGLPEQITFGPTEEEGLAAGPDEHSVVTSVGVHESAIWIHDERGERSLSSEGEVVENYSPPIFGRDGKTLYYLLSHEGLAAGLWHMDVESGKSEPLFPGVAMIAFDVSPDGKQVVYAVNTDNGNPQLWIAPMDKSMPAHELGSPGKNMPHFGPHGEILFVASDGNRNYLERMNPDGTGQSKVFSAPIIEIQAISPARKWVLAVVPVAAGETEEAREMAIPVDGGTPLNICAGYCVPTWSPNGKFLFLSMTPSSQTNSGRSVAVAVGPGEHLPPLPAKGFSSRSDLRLVPGSQWLNREDLVPGEDPGHYAYVKTSSHRNIYRLTLP